MSRWRMMRSWVSRLWVALHIVRCERAGRLWVVEFDGWVWRVVEE